MAVKAMAIENREQDLTVEDRTIATEGKTPINAEEQLHRLRQRIKSGLNSVGDDPKKKDAPSCVECFQRGWIAAMKSLSKD